MIIGRPTETILEGNPMQYNTPKLQFLDVNSPLTHEEIQSARVQEISNNAIDTGFFDYPITIGKVSILGEIVNILLDGHHRLASAQHHLKLQRIPVLAIDYFCDSAVSVKAWRSGETVTKNDVIISALSRSLMPIKTSRHQFGFKSLPCNIPLSELR